MGLDLGGLLKGGIHRAGELIEQPFQVTRDIVKDPKHGFDTLKKIPGQNERNDSKMLSDGGIGGWVGKHPQESAGALVASIFGGWAAAGAYGAGAAGTAGAAGAGGAGAGAAGTGAGAIGGAGAGAYMAPTAAGGVATSGGGALASSAPATSSLLSMGHAGVGAASSTAGASSFTPAMLTTQGAAASGGTFGAASAPAASLATPASSLGSFSTSSLGAVQSVPQSGGGMNAGDWNNVSRVLNSVKQPENDSPRASAPQMSPAYKASYRGNNFENPLLTKTMQDIYSQPMYSPLRVK